MPNREDSQKYAGRKEKVNHLHFVAGVFLVVFVFIGPSLWRSNQVNLSAP